MGETGERMVEMKKKEKEFCRLTVVTGNPQTAALRAGYKRPDEVWPELFARTDIAEEIRRVAREVSRVFRDTMLCSAYRIMASDNTDAVRLLYRDGMSDEEIRGMNLSGVAEIKRTKDKSVEIKFFDRIKMLDSVCAFAKLDDAAEGSGGLLEAMRLSAQALRESGGREADADER